MNRIIITWLSLILGIAITLIGVVAYTLMMDEEGVNVCSDNEKILCQTNGEYYCPESFAKSCVENILSCTSDRDCPQINCFKAPCPQYICSKGECIVDPNY